MVILKFGGTSVGSVSGIHTIENILRQYISEKKEIALVCSAFSGTTDLLLQAASFSAANNPEYKNCLSHLVSKSLDLINGLFPEESTHKSKAIEHFNHCYQGIVQMIDGIYALQEHTPKSLDYIAAHGEIISNFILAIYFESKNIPVEYCDARQFICTNDSFGNALVDFESTNEKINAYFKIKHRIPIITGFIGATTKNETTTLGRGGSDYTAAIIGAALNVDSIEIWTDVDGVLTADPRKVKKAMCIDTMTYAEAFEMSHFGAKVIYPPTIIPATLKNIPVFIKNTFNATFPGTKISNEYIDDNRLIKGISSISNTTLLTLEGSGMFGVPGIAGRLFMSLARHKINVILITQVSSEHSISFAINPNDEKGAIEAINFEFLTEIKQNIILPIKVEKNLSIVAIVGESMRYSTGIAGKMMQSLGKNGINIVAIAQGSSELNISVVINNYDESKALNAIHNAFFISETRNVHIFIAGVGLIGSALLNQIKEQYEHIRQNNFLDLKLMGISNSKTIVFNQDYEGINYNHWSELLANSSVHANPDYFINLMFQYNLPNTIFIDNTAGSDYISFYEKILEHNISIITPNKNGITQDIKEYKTLRRLAKKKNTNFGYETNVGAGLPVISTIRNLLSSGDEITKINGVFSGSLSFIFNNFDSSKSFSSLVKTAGELGFLEPDPRIDLFGLDFRRKMLILARECGLDQELKDVVFESFLPKPCLEADTVSDFLKSLEINNDYFKELVTKAELENKKLRLVGTIENNQSTIELKAVDSSDPLYFLNGSDNMLVIYSKRYANRPLVIQGPGAGAEVTAAGIFAELIQFSM